MKSFLVTAVLLCIISIQFTFAQENPAIQRKGFVFGSSFGAGYSIMNFPDKKQSDFGFALDAKLGYMIKSDLAVLLTTNVSIYDYSGFGRDRSRDFGVLAPSVQYWFSNNFWLLGGIGLGGDNPVFWDIDFDKVDTEPLETKYYYGVGFVTGVGWEMYQRNNMVIDLKAKTSYRNVEMQEGYTNGVSLALLLGINFY